MENVLFARTTKESMMMKMDALKTRVRPNTTSFWQNTALVTFALHNIIETPRTASYVYKIFAYRDKLSTIKADAMPSLAVKDSSWTL